MNRLPLIVHTVYSELFELCRIAGTQPSHWPLSGNLLRVPVDGKEHWYFQKSRRTSPGKYQQREYVGPVGNEELEARVVGYETAKAAWKERAELVSTLKAAGAPAPTGKLAGLLLGLAEQGVLGRAILVGTAAFQAYGPLLGVRFGQASFQTLDLDLASIQLAGAGELSLLDALRQIDSSFEGIPGLHPAAPPTSYMNEAKLRVDVVAPLVGPDEGTLPATAIGSRAQPVRFLDFLLESAIQVALLVGGGVLASVPDPARFALHKLLVAGRRPAVEAGKRRKDIQQAEQLLEVLAEDNPEAIRTAYADVKKRGPGWRKAFEKGAAGIKNKLFLEEE